MVHIITPYSVDKNLGKAYNVAMALIPDNDWACILDYDVMLLTPDAGQILNNYAEMFDGDNDVRMLTCFTNRIHPMSKQLFGSVVNDNSDIKNHISIAESRKEYLYQTTELDVFSGFLMLIKKQWWEEQQFTEDLKCLGVDSDYRERLAGRGKKTLRMDGLYVWHTYRIMNGIRDKRHLLC